MSDYDFDFAMKYLETGGLGEVVGIADMARQMDLPKVVCATDTAMALCVLAQEGLDARKKAKVN